MKVLLTGATGLIGRQLAFALQERKHQVFAITRNPAKAQKILPENCELITGDLSQTPVFDTRLKEVEAVVHLLGENIGEERWTAERKAKILNSRVQGTKNLLFSLQENKNWRVCVSASAIGYYGDAAEAELTEKSKPYLSGHGAGTRFLSEVCQQWENSFSSLDSRVVILRLGIVLSQQGGALPQMLKPFRFGMGSVLGSGNQWMSWIHQRDLVRIFIAALEDETMFGVYNAVAPKPVRQREFNGELAKILKKWSGPSVPSVALRTLLGEMASLVLASQKVSPQRLLQEGFAFDFPDLSTALADLLGKN